MTNPIPPVSEPYSPSLLPRDAIRTVIALAIIVLTIGGWIYVMVFDVMRWIFEFKEGQLRIPIALILYALFIWRLQLARRTVAAEQRAVAVQRLSPRPE